VTFIAKIHEIRLKTTEFTEKLKILYLELIYTEDVVKFQPKKIRVGYLNESSMCRNTV
jgi:hypothetical protein